MKIVLIFWVFSFRQRSLRVKPGSRSVDWQCQKQLQIPRNKIAPVSCLLLWVACLSFPEFIIHKVKVSVQSECNMHRGGSSRNQFFASQTRGLEIRIVRENEDDPHFGYASVRVYGDDPHICGRCLFSDHLDQHLLKDRAKF